MGDLPEWFYVSHHVPAVLPAHRAIVSEVNAFLNSDSKCRLIAVTGPLGSGKTTACMMAAAEISVNHLNVHHFNGLNGIEIEHLWNTIKDTRGLFCLVIDAAYEHFYAINAVFERIMDRATSCRLCVIIEERTRQYERNKHHFMSSQLDNIRQIKVENLNLASATKLYDKSFELGIRFEKLTGKTRKIQSKKLLILTKDIRGSPCNLVRFIITQVIPRKTGRRVSRN